MYLHLSSYEGSLEPKAGWHRIGTHFDFKIWPPQQKQDGCHAKLHLILIAILIVSLKNVVAIENHYAKHPTTYVRS